ncbi:MAG TPA: small, acid-soluble spore protein, alpha/beta type [Verrucomicrobiae bacterium]|nr:small, acid-soluble spore protein, alpha/beta type [Verrucomicrobiae bacterium]
MAKYNLPISKQQVERELGIQTGGDVPARQNGRVGGQMVKRTFEQLGHK